MTYLPPATHNADPATAHAAEERMNRGARQSHAAHVLAEVERRPGLTAKEYGDITLLGHHEAQRRLSDLATQGEVVKAAPDVYKGTRMTTWRIPGVGTQGELF